MRFFELKMRQIVPLVMLCCFGFFGSRSAQAQVSTKTDPGTNNPPPPGAILDLSGTAIPGGGNNTYQQYSVNFTASLSHTAITLAFRDDPAQVFVANVSVVDLANPSVNLLVNGNFSQGPVGSNTPTGWTYANVFGVIAGGSVQSGCGVGGGNCWLDGAVQGYDAISQTIATTIGHTYQISFDLAEDSATFAVPGSFHAGYPGSDCYLAAHGGPSPCKFSNISINGDTTDPAGNGIDVTAYAQGGLPGTQTTYTSDTNIADFTSNVASYATFSNFSNGDGCASSPFTPTSAELAGPNACRVYTGGTLTGLSGSNWILASFSSPTSAVVVFPNIDHFGSAFDGYQYKIRGSNDLSTWSMLFDATSVNGCVSSCVVVGGEPFTLGNFTGTAPTTVNNVLTPGAGPGGSVGYIAQFQFGTAYKYYAFGASTVAVAQGNPDQELSAVGTPAMQVQSTPPTNFTTTTTDTTVSVVFNNNNGQHVQGDAIFPKFTDLSFPSNINATTVRFQETNRFVADCRPYTIGTPFATCIPFDHAGNDAMAGTTGNGAKYEIICADANNPPSETNCPIPNAGKHIRFKDLFDLPKDGMGNFIQPAIPFGTTVSFIHWFPNFHLEITSWSPSTASPHAACTNVFTATFACDFEDALVNKWGESGGFGSDKRKGDYLLVYNIPMLCSAVKVNGMPVNTPCVQGSSTFFFHSPLTFDFLVNPAQCNPALPVACGNGWKAAPVDTLFYTFDPLSSAPDLPGATDFEDFISCPGANCAVAGSSPAQPGTSSTLAVEFTTTPMPEPEAQFLLQEAAADTVKIRERNIQILPVPPLGSPNPCPNPFNENPPPMPPCYSTKLFNVPIIVDNTIPTISSGPTLSATGTLPVTVTYTCSDTGSAVAADNSGIAICGATAPGTTHNVSPLGGPGAGPSSVTEVDTLPSAVGPYSFTVQATDVAGNLSAASQVNYTVYGICALYDQTKAVHSGATIPVKMYLCNGTTDVSSSSIVVHATGLFQMSTSTSDPVIDAGNANPDMDFRFDSTLGPSGGYIFNLKTSGLGSGNWVIQFTVGGDPTLHSLGFGVK